MNYLILKWLRKLQYIYNCRNFDRKYYLEKYPDVAKAGVDPLEHYKKYGRYEGRYVSLANELESTMDQKDYVKRYPDVARLGMDAVMHYLQHGQVEGREIDKCLVAKITQKTALDELKQIRELHYLYNCRNFDPEYYLEKYPDVAKAGVNPLGHYKKYGRYEGRYSSLANELEFTMNQKGYLEEYPEVDKLGLEPVIHYLQRGKDDGKEIIKRGEFTNSQQITNIPNYGYAAIKYTTSNKQLEPSITEENAYKIFHTGEFKQRIEEYKAKNKKNKKNKIAVFTAISNNYDSLKIPSFINDDYDYICFANTDMEDTGIWEIRPCLYLSSDPTRITRYIKTHAHYLLSEYDIAIWIDSNLVITGDITEEIDRTIDSGLPCATFYHPFRENVYEEAIAVTKLKKDEAETVEMQVKHLKEQEFKHNDLAETNFMIFNLKHKKTRDFLNFWWKEIDFYSKRDQLSFNFSLYKNNTKYYPLAEKYVCARNYDKLIYCRHDGKNSSSSLLLQSLFRNKINPYYGRPFSDVKEERIASIKGKSIDVIICVHNAFEDFKNCINSVITARKFNEYNVIIVDDGSDKETRDFIASLPSTYSFISVTRNEVAERYTKAANKGLSLSNGDFVILLNSDTIVSAGWVEKMAIALFTTPGAGIVGPLSNAATWQSIPSNLWKITKNPLPEGLSIEEVNHYLEEWTIDGCFPKIPLINGCCFGISREVINKVGYLDDINFEKGYGEEDDYCFRVREHGFDLLLATNTYIFHAASKSYDKSVARELIAAGGKNLRKKHGTARIGRAIKDMKENSILKTFRGKAELLFGYTKFLPKVIFMPDMGLGGVRFLPYFQINFPFLVYNAVAGTTPYLPAIGSYNVVMINRLFNGFGDNPYFPTWVRRWKSANGKIIYDLDDDFFDIEGISSRTKISVEEAQGNLEKVKTFIQLADTVTVSTPALLERVLPYNSNTSLVRNVLDEDLWDLTSDSIAADKKTDTVIRIGYIGTPSHIADVEIIKETAQKIEAEYGEKVVFEFIGVFNKEIPPFGTNIHVKNSYYPAFIKWLLRRVNWDIGIIPLKDDTFNRGKSDLKFLEYSALGIAIAVSNVPTYKEVIKNEENCLAVENTTDAWYAALKRLIEDGNLRQRLARQAKQDVRAFSAQNNIEIYKEVINKTLEGK